MGVNFLFHELRHFGNVFLKKAIYICVSFVCFNLRYELSESEVYRQASSPGGHIEYRNVFSFEGKEMLPLLDLIGKCRNTIYKILQFLSTDKYHFLIQKSCISVHIVINNH